MTRVELYKTYREEISKSSRLGKSIKDSDENVIKYTKAIKRINPAILHSIKNETAKFDSGVFNIDVENKQLPESVIKYFESLNKAAINQQSEQINNFFHNNINHSIVGADNQFDNKWFESNKDYAQLSLINSDISNNFVEEEQFVGALTDKYNTMSSPIGIAKVKKLNEIKPINEGSGTRKAIISISVITVIMMCALIALIIVRGVMK